MNSLTKIEKTNNVNGQLSAKVDRTHCRK